MSLQAAFSDLREAINSINRYRTIFEHPPLGTLTDKLGTIKIIKSESTGWGPSEVRVKDAFVIKDNLPPVTIDCLPNNVRYINMANNINSPINVSDVMSHLSISFDSTNKYVSGSIYSPETLILPINFSGIITIIPANDIFKRGLYLNKYGSNILYTENRIINTYHIDRAKSEANVNFDSGYNMTPMYLNRLYLSTSTFSNLSNKLGKVTNGKLYLGEKNTSRMTSAQKTAIQNKGWIIY